MARKNDSSRNTSECDNKEGGLGSWFGNLFSSDSASERSNKSKKADQESEGTMSRSEAGRLGGLAPHRCRGRECDEERSSQKESSSRNRNEN